MDHASASRHGARRPRVSLGGGPSVHAASSGAEMPHPTDIQLWRSGRGTDEARSCCYHAILNNRPDIKGRHRVHRVFFAHDNCAIRFFRLVVFASIAKQNGWVLVTYRITHPPYYFSDLPSLDLDNVDFDTLRRPEPEVVNLLN